MLNLARAILVHEKIRRRERQKKRISNIYLNLAGFYGPLSRYFSFTCTFGVLSRRFHFPTWNGRESRPFHSAPFSPTTRFPGLVLKTKSARFIYGSSSGAAKPWFMLRTRVESVPLCILVRAQKSAVCQKEVLFVDCSNEVSVFP